MTKTTDQERFWSWFVRHEEELFDFEVDQERIFDQVATELQNVDSDLTFEFGPKETRREFVISAGGMKRAFSAVISLVDAAPTLVRWRVTAFRPRRLPPDIVEFRGRRVHAKDVQFSLLDNGETAGIYLFIPGFREDDAALMQIGYLLLDHMLGEYDVESSLALIKMFSPTARTNRDRYPLAELPALFDRLVSQIEGRSGRPS
jgi:hypothetical protein